MTLGGLALAVGILVDDATVEIENINRNFEMGKEIEQAILDGAAQIAVPAFVSTLEHLHRLRADVLPDRRGALPVRAAWRKLLSFAMLASYLLSRTIVPTMAKYLLKGHSHHDAVAHAQYAESVHTSAAARLRRGFEKLRFALPRCSGRLHSPPRLFYSLLLCRAVLLHWRWFPWLGQDFFPAVDSGQFRLHVRAQTGTRIEETAKLCDLIEDSIREVIPPNEVGNILDNIGLPYSGINTSYSNYGAIGPADADIQVSLAEDHQSDCRLRGEASHAVCREQFPGVLFYFLPADMVSQILNFGLAGADRHSGAGQRTSKRIASLPTVCCRRSSYIPGITDLRIQQPFNQPKLFVNIDRTKAQQVGYSARDVAGNVLVSLSGSFQTSPTFWLNPRTASATTSRRKSPQYDMDSLQNLRNIPVSCCRLLTPQILANLRRIQTRAGARRRSRTTTLRR